MFGQKVRFFHILFIFEHNAIQKASELCWGFVFQRSNNPLFSHQPKMNCGGDDNYNDQCCTVPEHLTDLELIKYVLKKCK